MTVRQKSMRMLTPLTAEIFDVAVVGAGVVGCAIARRFALEGARVAIVEKAPDILDGASKANSAILHTGFDAPPGSLELSCIRDGYREYTEIHHEMGLPLDKSGAHVVAYNDAEAAALDEIIAQARGNGEVAVELIDPPELHRREPNLSMNAVAALSVPGESIVDPWSAPYAYVREALDNGAAVFVACEVTSGAFGAGRWQLETSRGSLSCRHVINCAGLHGDTLDKAILGESTFEIRPRKGQFVVYDKAAAKLVNSIILPVPTERTKGIVVCRTVFGNVLVGPTAEDQESRSDTSTDEAALRSLIGSASEKIPRLGAMPVTAVYAGLRPATERKEYRIDAKLDRNWITVGGIRSTGLSAALGIARHVFGLNSDWGVEKPRFKRRCPTATPMIAEIGLRDWQREGHGEIVCYCEMATEREIKKALTGPLAARSLAGLKRQTRATMGRCQGFYCSARLAELTDGCFDNALFVGSGHD